MAIDHEQRRRHIAEITNEIIAREGVGAATIRRIAEQAGFSTAAITHYFADKQELLLWAFEVLAAEGDIRLEAELERDPDDIIGALLTMVAWCPANMRRWKIYLSFWDQAARDPQLAKLLERATQKGAAYIESLLMPRSAEGVDVPKGALLISSLIHGMSIQALVTPDKWPPDLIRRSLEDAVAAALTGEPITTSSQAST